MAEVDFLFPNALITSDKFKKALTTVWKNLKITPEKRTTPYDRSQYPYTQDLERQKIKEYGGSIFSPYTKETFKNRFQTDIEHIVSISEAHDSGLSQAEKAEKVKFANDLLNITLASPKVNRELKGSKDAGEWLPPKNQCWFAQTIVEVKQKYKLSVDKREVEALKRLYSSCKDFKMRF